MKRIVAIIITIFFGGLLTTQAQVTFKPGFRAGLTHSTITNTEADYKTDIYFGVIGELKLSRFYTMQPEINYSRQGASSVVLYYYDYNVGYNIMTSEQLKFSYISLSLVNKFTFPGGINVHLGPTFDIEAGSSRYSNSSVDLAFVFGVGYKITNDLSVEARVKKGIIDVFESDYLYNTGGNYYYDDYNTNFLFQIGLSYTFDLTKVE